MNILITGVAGFIGSHLASFLLRKKHHVIGIDNLLTGNKRNLNSFYNNPLFLFIESDITHMNLDALPQTDLIIHLASPASPIQYQKYPLETLLVNSLGTKNILDYMLKTRSKKFLISSTSEVYGDPMVHPQPESYWGNVNPVGIRSCYDESKRFAESLCMTYCIKYDLDIRIARIFNTYGPQMEKNDGRVVSNFIVQALANKPITIYGDGRQTRSFCYIEDMVEGLYRLGTYEKLGGEIVNLGNPVEYSIQELAINIKKMSKSQSCIQYQALPSDDPKKRRPDITKAKKLLQWTPKINIDKGLKNTIAYFQSI